MGRHSGQDASNAFRGVYGLAEVTEALSVRPPAANRLTGFEIAVEVQAFGQALERLWTEAEATEMRILTQGSRITSEDKGVSESRVTGPAGDGES